MLCGVVITSEMLISLILRCQSDGIKQVLKRNDFSCLLKSDSWLHSEMSAGKQVRQQSCLKTRHHITQVNSKAVMRMSLTT